MDLGKVWYYLHSKVLSGEMGDFLLSIDQAQEISIAQTRSFASMLVISQALAAAAGGRNLALFNHLPARVGEVFNKYSNIAQKIGEDLSLDRFFFLGTGHLYGIACEAMLKMKEMTVSYSEAFHMLEFRHGPMSMVNHQSLVVGLVSDSAKKKEVEL